METATPKQILLNTFSSIKLDESTHTYYVSNEKYPSSTTSIVGKFADKFDEDKMSNLIAIKEGVTQQEILDRWAETRIEACERGSLVHKCLEHIPMIDYHDALLVLKDKLTDPEYTRLFNHKELRQVKSGINWYLQLKAKYGDRYEILVLELMMFLPSIKHCGTADMILWDNYEQKLIIADWKTNKDLFKVDYYKTRQKKFLFKPFSELLDCPYSKYVLQFSHYQMMIEKATPLRVADRWCVWLTDDNIVSGYIARGDGWVQYNTPDYSKSLLHYFSQQQNNRPTSLSGLCKK